MSVDLVTWNPRRGSSGDDKYNVPGAQELSGAFASESKARLDAGNASGFSTIPTIAEINASSGINQVIGLLNRRILNNNAIYGTSLTTTPYVSSGDRALASKLAGIISGGSLTNINALRAAEGFSAYTFSYLPSQYIHCYGGPMADARKALAISGTLDIPATGREYLRSDAVYGSTSGASESFPVTPIGYVGKFYSSPGGAARRRILFSFQLPEFAYAITAARLAEGSGPPTFDGLESYQADVYSSDSDDSSPSLGSGFDGSAYNLDHYEGFLPSGPGSFFYYSSLANIIARAGAIYSIVTGQDHELNNSGGTPYISGFTLEESYCNSNASGSLALTF